MEICIVVGTRPEIIKMSPIIRECIRRKQKYFILHTGQHYSYNMDKQFFKELRLPRPKYHLNVGSGMPGQQLAKIIEGVEKVITKTKPDIVLVQGDTNTVLGGAIAANKAGIKVGHVEAGLRSFDRSMPEEINRILADHCSDFLFAPTELSKGHLNKEGIKDGVYVTGNTIVDAVKQNVWIANKRSKICRKLGVINKRFGVLTIHRQENVDSPEKFKRVITALEKIDYPIVYPIHPRSKKMAKKFGLLERMNKNKNLIVIEPVGYMDFLCMLSNSNFVLTDSGGVQEEAVILNIPCITLRDSTERQETVEIGANVLVGTNTKKIVGETKKLIHRSKVNYKNPYGDGKSGERILDILA
jgi:UDP-N-acetylglucosamine 2-epimerase (non-hydrolysing)